MSNSFIKALEKSYSQLGSKFAGNLQMTFREEKRDEGLSYFTSASIDFENDMILGQIIVYHSGECDIHVMKNDTSLDSIFIESHSLKSENELTELVANTLNRVASLKGFCG